MSQLLLHIMTSLDGYYAGPNGELDWHYADAEHEKIAIELLDNTDLLLFGRVTYEMMAEYWPAAPSDPIADRMNTRPKAVISNALKKADWNNTRLVEGDAADAVNTLKKTTDGRITLLGSGKLATALAEADLIDEYHVMVCPIAIGRGIPFFVDLRSPRRFTLRSAQSRRSGVVDLRYIKAV